MIFLNINLLDHGVVQKYCCFCNQKHTSVTLSNGNFMRRNKIMIDDVFSFTFYPLQRVNYVNAGKCISVYHNNKQLTKIVL